MVSAVIRDIWDRFVDKYNHPRYYEKYSGKVKFIEYYEHTLTEM